MTPMHVARVRRSGAPSIAIEDRPIIVRESPVNRPTVARATANHLELFGGGVVYSGGDPVTGRAVQRHRIALLALLATTKRLGRSRDQLVAFLWPDTDAERGRRLLSDSVYRINQALGGSAIVGTGDDLRVDRDQLGGDVADFETAVDARDWRLAADIYSGPFLDGFYLPGAVEFDQWMETERARYARTIANALETLAVDARDAGRVAESADWWHRLAALVPDNSRVAMELMRAKRLESDDITAPTSPATEGTIAVLRFHNVGDSEDDSDFATGVSEELLYSLTRTPGLRVASRTSSFAYRGPKLDVREVARRLQVAWVVEGSVRRSGGTLRIVAQLTDAKSGYQIWSQCFDRSSSEVFAIQTEIAGTIANRIAPFVRGEGR